MFLILNPITVHKISETKINLSAGGILLLCPVGGGMFSPFGRLLTGQTLIHLLILDLWNILCPKWRTVNQGRRIQKVLFPDCWWDPVST